MLIQNEQIQTYKTWLEASNYSDNVKKSYLYYAKGLVGKDIRSDNINELCANKHGVYRSFLKTIFKALNINIMVPNIRGRKIKKEVIYYTPQEMQVIFNNVKDVKLHLIIYLMYRLGLRVSEVVNIKKKDFDFVNVKLTGVGKGKKEFKISVPNEIIPILNDYLNEFSQEDYVFKYGVRHERQKILYEIKKALQIALPYKKKNEIFCHAFRHTCGTHLMNKGLNLRKIQEYLRHEQLETVSRYTSVNKEKLEQEVSELF